MNGKKFIFIDLDSTLVDDYERINPQNLEVIKNTNANFVINTGRDLYSAEKLLEKHGLTNDIIAVNGSLIKRKDKIEVLSSLDDNIVQNIIRYLSEKNAVFVCYCPENKFVPSYIEANIVSNKLAHYHVEESNPEYSAWFNAYLDLFTTNVEKFDNKYENRISENEVLKIEILNENSLELDNIKNDLRAIPGIDITKSYYTNIEILPHGTNKGAAVQQYLLEVPLECITVAIGDNYNDLEMLNVVDYGFFVSNTKVNNSEIRKLKLSCEEPFLNEVFEKLDFSMQEKLN